MLIDPVWSDRASPLSFAGPRRLVPPGIRFDDLPSIHITFLSHDHYDHLDDATIRRLIDRFPSMRWVAPLGVAAFLEARGARNVAEFDWWDKGDIESVRISSTPAQHFAGRYPWNRNATLWCGWTMLFGDGSNVFYAGDTGLHPEFGEIATRLGPFDMAILPIGAYEPRWFMRPVHMSPEESVAAYGSLSSGNSSQGTPACVMVGCHWGTFRLTEEPAMEPPIRCRKAFSTGGFRSNDLWILAHGETRTIERRG